MNQEIPLALNGNQLDTTSNYVINRTSISIVYYNLTDIASVQYFDNLDTLVIRGNNLTNNIPRFPNSLTNIDVSANYLTSLPTLPSNLVYLDASDNLLTSLPPLNDSLRELWVYTNQLTSLPNLPTALGKLICNRNQITSLPNLPNSLLTLACDDNNLIALPSLPNSLLSLQCANNNITALPTIPDSLQYLWFNNNQISSLPDTLPLSLSSLVFDFNQITEIPTLPENLLDLIFSNNLVSVLPELPAGLQYLVCSKNYLSYLPPLPSTLSILLADSNQITCFPPFPESCSNIQISGNLNTCIPSSSIYMDPISVLLPICVNNDNLNNPNNCTGSSLIGTVFNDLNNDCILQNEIKLKNVPIDIYNENQEYVGTTTTSQSGNFYSSVAAVGYTIKIDTSNFLYTTNCSNPGYDTTLTSIDTNQLIDLEFGFNCPDNFDLSIQSIVNDGIVFPGQPHSLKILTGETSAWFGFECFSDLSGILNITAVGPIQFEGVPPMAITPTASGFIYSYNVSDFTTVTNNSFELLFLVDTTAQAGDNVTVYAEILSNDNEINISNNSMVFNYQVVNSYDPNMKEVYPQQVLPGYDDYFTYTIHFQNLGSAPAFNIRITDTLSSNLDVETFQVINYSAPNTITINNNILQVRFPNIILPDSASNPEGSKGFIQYKIKPKSGLAVDSTIKNTAYIYFDYNPAVVTNTAITEYVETLNVAAIEKESTFKIFPNPSNGQINITTDLELNGEIKIQLFDLSGKELKIDKIENVNSTKWKIYLNENNGFYILKITDSEGNVFKKKIVLN